jgi:hypothetical protein
MFATVCRTKCVPVALLIFSSKFYKFINKGNVISSYTFSSHELVSTEVIFFQ